MSFQSVFPAPPARPRVPPEIRLELFSRDAGFWPRITRIVESLGPSEGEPAEWLSKLTDYLAGGDAMIVNARLGRTLVGFVVLNTPDLSAPFAWVDPRFRNKGLGERFYSFACVNMAVPQPEFRFPEDHLDEFGFALKSAGIKPTLRDSFYVMNERSSEDLDEESGEGAVNAAVDVAA